MWSGRQPHNILHKHNNITVRGAWNNYEGVGACTPDPEGSPNSGRNDGCAPSIGGATTVTEQQLIAPMLEAGGYHTMVTGKDDLTKASRLGFSLAHNRSLSEQGTYHSRELGISDGCELIISWTGWTNSTTDESRDCKTTSLSGPTA